MSDVLQRYQTLLVYAGVLVASIMVGRLAVQDAGRLTMPMVGFLALAGAIVLTTVPYRLLFLGWLFVAPIFQSSADTTLLGRTLTWAFFTAPLLVFAVLTVVRRERGVRLTWVDWLPGAYVAYVVTAMLLTSSLIEDNPTGTAKVVLTIIASGAIVYYFIVVGPGARIPSKLVLATLMAAASLQGVMALVDIATGWNIWRFTEWQEALGPPRAVATLANPALLGMFLGTSIVIAVAVLTWNGPRSLRRLSWFTLAACVPGLIATLTRGPVLATAVAVILLLLLGRARVLGIGVLALSAIVVVLLLPTFRNTEIYQDRVAERANVTFREVLRDWSIKLALEKPVFGWGYGSFDQVKNTSGFYAEGVPIRNVLSYTSHDTYLTVLVELGFVGVALLAAPFLMIGLGGLARARAPGPDRWLPAAMLGSLLVVFVSASTLDLRFFSIGQLLPFLLLALLRRSNSAPAAPDA